MVVNPKLRKRRKQRIKEILEQSQHPISQQSNIGKVQPVLTPIEVKPHDKRLEDPEYVWKMKNNRWNLDKDSYPMTDRNNRLLFFSKKQLALQTMVSVVLFALIWGMFNWNHPLADQGKQTVTRLLTSEFQFQKANEWYERFFRGSPALIPAFQKKKAENVQANMKEPFILPIQGDIIVPFPSTNKGIQIQAAPQSPVYAMSTGRVIYFSEKEETGITMVIQHARGWLSIYSWVGQTSLRVNDWVEGGQQIGKLSSGPDPKDAVLYFSIQKDHQFVNPADVIAFD